MAKVIDMLSSIGIRKEGRGVQQNLYSELSNLVDEVLDLSKRMKDLEKKYKVMTMFETNQNRMEDAVKSQFEKIVKIFQNLLSKQELLDKELEQIKENIKKPNNNITSATNHFDSLLNHLTPGVGGSTPKVGNVERQINFTDGYTSADGVVDQMRLEMEDLRREMKELRLELETIKATKDENGDAVEIGGYRFVSRDHLLLWATSYLPEVIPYGCYTDIYTFLNRMIMSGFGNSLHELVNQHKLGLAGDDAITLESFQSPLPKLFGNTNTLSELKSSHHSSIPSMPTATFWEDPKSNMGIKDRLKKQIPNIKAQIMSNIGIRLADHPVGYSVAVACLEATVSFLNTLISWVSETNQRLTSHGYSADLSWKLITQVLYHVFTSDLDKARNFVRDGVDTSNTATLHGSILWGIFKTHEAMQTYMNHGFGAHPAVACQYLDFLVNSRGEDSDETEAKALKHISKLEVQLNAVEKIAKEAKSSAGTANNNVNQLKNKFNNQRGGAGGGNQG